MNRVFTPLLLAVVAVLNNVSCAGTVDPGVQPKLQLKVGQTQLRLEDGGGVCRATASTGEGAAARYILDVPWPCHFHVDKAGNVRTIQGASHVYVLVESSTRVKGASSDECETFLRSIRINGKRVEVSPHRDRVASCPPFQWDALVFKELFD